MQMNNQAINWGLLRFDKFTISFLSGDEVK